MKNLILSSLFLLLSACSFSRYNELIHISDIQMKGDEIPSFLNDSAGKLVYKTSVNVYGNYMSGLIVIKKTDDTTFRTVLITELGIKIFDFEFSGNNFIKHFCIPPLDKGYILSTIRNDISLIAETNYKGKKASYFEDYNRKFRILKIEKEDANNYYYFDRLSGKLAKIENASLWLRNVEIKFNTSADTIEADHCNFDINIKLYKLKQ